jgi:hypothetical protein
MKKPGREFLFTFLHYTFGIGVIIFLLSVPIASRLGVAFRSDFSTIAIGIFLLYLIFSLFPGTIKNTLIFSFIAFLFAISVAGLWGSGQSEQYLIGGIIPFSDARFYYMDARRLLEGAQFVTGAGRRPLFAALLSSLQWTSGQNLYLSIGFLIIIISLTTYFAVREVHSSENPVAAGLFLVLIFFYIRFLLGKTMSEMIGLPVGLLAFYFLYRSSKEKRNLFFLIGLFLLTLALNARAGAFFILPMLVIWGGLVFPSTKRINWRIIVQGAVVIILGFGINLLVFNQLSKPDSTPFGNFSFTLYGLSRGGQSWTLIYEEHPEFASLPSGQAYASVYQMAFDNIRHNPGDLVRGIAGSYATFFSLDDYYGSLCWFGGSNTIGAVARLFIYILMAVGIISTTKKYKDASQSLMLLAFIGIVLSIVAIPPRDSNRMRVFAATFPFFAIIPALGLSTIFSKIPLKRRLFSQSQSISPLLPGSVGVMLILMMTVLPVTIKDSTKPQTINQLTCPEGFTSLSFRLLSGNYIKIHDQGSLKQDWVPDLQKQNFSRLAHDLPNWELFPVLTKIGQGQMLISDLNLNDMNEMMLIADWDKVSHSGEIQSICAKYQTDTDLKLYNVYIAD